MTPTPDRANPYRILGINGDRVGPFGLLGLSPERCERTDVLKALRGQLARIDAHPATRTTEAEELRRRLRRAADLLLDPTTLEALRQQYQAARREALKHQQHRQTQLHQALAGGKIETRRPALPSAFPTRSDPESSKSARPNPATRMTAGTTPATAPALTGRSQHVHDTEIRAQLRLALMTGGGWNRRTKSRAVAIAASHGLSPRHLSAELLAVVSGMSSGSMRHPGPTVVAAPVRSAASPLSRPVPAPEEPFRKRMAAHRDEKIAIAKAAARLIKPGQSLFVDAGTTTSVFAAELAKVSGISVVTNSFDIATTLRRAESGTSVLLLGGRIVTDVPGTYGELTLSEIARFRTDVAVVSPVALHPEGGAGNYDLHEAEVARAMIEQSAKLIMLADHAKLCVSSQVRFCTCGQIDTLVTGASASAEKLAQLKRAGVKSVVKAR